MTAGPPDATAAVALARRVVRPARLLAAVARLGFRVAAVAGGVLWCELFVPPLLRGSRPWGLLVGALVSLALLGLPAWWLRHAGEAFTDLTVLPDRLGTLQRQRRPDLTIGSREDLRRLRHGGLGGAARDVFKTVRELVDFVGPASSVVEVAAPVFWLVTAAAGVATVLLVVLAVTVGPLVLLLG